LGRMVWGSAALGDGRAPPHTPCAFPLSPAALVRVGLQAAGSVCSHCPVHHWAGSGLAIRCHAIRLQLAAQADAIEASPVPPKPVIPRTTVTKCENAPPHHPNVSRVETFHGML